jgi:diguanylate cyclase
VGGNRRLVAYLAIQGVIVAISYLLPVTAGGAVRLSVAIAGIGVLVWAVLVRRPSRRAGWLLVALSGLFALGQAVTIAALYGLGPGERVATVSQFALGLFSQLALAAGLVVLGWRSAGTRNWDALDTSMVAIGAFILLWTFYLDHAITSGSTSFATIIVIAVPATSLLIFAMAVKLAFGGVAATSSGRFLLVATAAGLGAVGLFFEPVGARTIEVDQSLVIAGLTHTILLGAVGLAADFPVVLTGRGQSAPELPRWRLILFLALAVLAPLDVAIDIKGTGASGPTVAAVMVPSICSTLIFVLLVIRLALVARVARRRELELNDRSASLARAMAEQSQLQRQLAYRALHDPLTGLANRNVLSDRMELLHNNYGVRRDLSSRGQALMMLDLDGFKDVNDTFGHPVGDQLLVDVAHRLATVASGDSVVVRLGGDEFAMLLENTPAADARRAAEATLQALRSPYFVAGRELFLSASIGLLITEPGARTPGSSEGLRDVDQALYAAKAAGRNRMAEFHPSLLEQRLHDARASTGLHHATAKNELLLHYQPLVALDDRRIVGVEALVRWQPHGQKMVSPAEFIPVAERTGLIIEVGTWVLRQACRDARAWHERYGIPVGVNVSGRQLADPSFADIVLDTLVESGLPGSALVLELTESSLIESVVDPAMRAQLDRLKEREVRIVIDDFGTGYSSLAYIARLPADGVKIDSSFTPNPADSAATDQNWALVRAILQLVSSLELPAVAEGVETREQAEMLRKLNCPYAQGYHFSPPLPAAQIGSLLDHGPPRDAGRLD